jgi:hypothetical protein
MICPVEIARDMSALRTLRIRDHAKHGSLSKGRDGAGNEGTGRDVASDGEEDHTIFARCSEGCMGFCPGLTPVRRSMSEIAMFQ